LECDSAGDILDALLSLMVVQTAKKVDGGLPSALLMRMYLLVLIDFVVGFVPFLGDIGDAIFKANARNAVYLEEHLRQKGKKNLRASGVPAPEVDPSDPNEFDRYQSASSPPSYTATQPGSHGNMTQGSHHPQSSGVAQNPTLPTRPQQAQVHEDRPARGGSFFGFGGSKKSRPADIETGLADQDRTNKSSRRG
jgi:hypothetical protein